MDFIQSFLAVAEKVGLLFILIAVGFVCQRIKMLTEEANKKLAESLTPNILEKMYYEKWNGILPEVYGANGTIVNVP